MNLILISFARPAGHSRTKNILITICVMLIVKKNQQIQVKYLKLDFITFTAPNIKTVWG